MGVSKVVGVSVGVAVGVTVGVAAGVVMVGVSVGEAVDVVVDVFVLSCTLEHSYEMSASVPLSRCCPPVHAAVCAHAFDAYNSRSATFALLAYARHEAAHIDLWSCPSGQEYSSPSHSFEGAASDAGRRCTETTGAIFCVIMYASMPPSMQAAARTCDARGANMFYAGAEKLINAN